MSVTGCHAGAFLSDVELSAGSVHIILDSSVERAQRVNSIEATNINFHNDLVNITSGQLRNLGSLYFPNKSASNARPTCMECYDFCNLM